MHLTLTFVVVLFITIASLSAESDKLHPKKLTNQEITDFTYKTDREQSSEFWMDRGQSILKDLVGRKDNTNHAKNVIMFLGDGMGLTTVAAARMYLGDEDMNLSFEKFPHIGFSKTYCVDAQVADSACTATSYLSAVKTNYEVVGLNAKAKLHDCEAQTEENFTESIASWAQKAGKATGVVTNTRITHASPAGVYAHAAFREWENDYEMSLDGCDTDKLDDIAEQLVYNTEGKNLKVIFGGGRAGFRNRTVQDEEGKNGHRTDGRDLISEWKEERNKMGKASYIFDRNGLRNLDIANTDYVLGLFEHDHMKYNKEVVDQNLEHQEPTLTEMTVAAIRMLQKEENGYFLFVEGGMIDQAHHDNYAQLSLDETKEFSRAVEAARFMTDESDTLIVVTADHSHAFTYNGYPSRGSPIFGSPEVSDEDNLPYTTLSYANGPGFANTYNEDGTRVNPKTYDTTNPRLQFPATVPRNSETHGGEDVGVWASGPMAHLFRGSYDQTSIPMIMAYVLQVGPYELNASVSLQSSIVLLFTSMLISFKMFA